MRNTYTTSLGKYEDKRGSCTGNANGRIILNSVLNKEWSREID
jgi:hypothetical protein